MNDITTNSVKHSSDLHLFALTESGRGGESQCRHGESPEPEAEDPLPRAVEGGKHRAHSGMCRVIIQLTHTGRNNSKFLVVSRTT